MPVDHEAKVALPTASAAVKTALRAAMYRRMAYVLSDSDDPTQFIPQDPDSGVIALTLIYIGQIYIYDAADTTTAHDGVTCLVTIGGHRYKLAANTDVVAYSVVSVLSTPPGSPTVGDSYLLGASPTGVWSGHGSKVAIYTAVSGWRFVIPAIGRFIYVRATDTYYHKNSGGAWTAGFGAQALPAASVYPSAMLGGGDKVNWIVENQTTNTPPAVVNGRSYIIGPSPTGAWVGHSNKIAHGEGGAWVIYTPAEGWKAYDKAENLNVQYNGSAWGGSSGEFEVVTVKFSASGTWTKPAGLSRVHVTVIAEGYAGGVTLSSSFGAHCSATGGSAGSGGNGASGDVNGTGDMAGVGYLGYGKGAAGVGSGGISKKWIMAADLAATVAVTCGKGAGGAGNPYVIVEQHIYA